MELGKKIKAVRIAEEISQDTLAELTHVPIGTIRNCEQGRSEIGSDALTKITNHERFEKYAYWLVTGKVLPESGQISPDFSILLHLGIIEESQESKRA